MASIVRRGKTFSVVHYEGTGKDRHQVWDSGLSYTAEKQNWSMKAWSRSKRRATT